VQRRNLTLSRLARAHARRSRAGSDRIDRRKDDEHLAEPNAIGVSRCRSFRRVFVHGGTINIEALLCARIYARTRRVHAECDEQGVYCTRALAAGPAGKPRFLSRDGKKETLGCRRDSERRPFTFEIASDPQTRLKAKRSS